MILFLVLLAGGPLGQAQDFTVAPLEWTFGDDAPDTLPVAELRAPLVPDEMRSLQDPAYLEVTLLIDEKGESRIVRLRTASQWLQSPETDFTATRFAPAHRKEKPLMAFVVTRLIFNPKSADRDAPEATPRLLSVVSPRQPAGARESADDVTATVEALIAVDGTVSAAAAVESPDAAHARAAEAAVRRWTFAPARRGGQPVAGKVRVSVSFRPSLELLPGELSVQPKVRHQAPPVYPISMRNVNLMGEVIVSFVVTVEGRVRSAFVVRSTNPAFDDAALEAVMKWQFAPGQKDGAAVETRLIVPMLFQPPGGGIPAFSIEPNPKAQAALPPELRFDTPPVLTNVALAVYPFEALRDGQRGKVKLAVYVSPEGRVDQVDVLTAPDPRLGEAARAAVETFTFKPALNKGRPSGAALAYEVEFGAARLGVMPVSAADRRLLKRLTQNPQSLPPVDQLDVPLRPISQRSPRFPLSLRASGATGHAMMELIVDRRGLARLPRVVSATAPAFGYAAAQAVASWRFEPPRRGGRTTEVLARIPVEFSMAGEDPAVTAPDLPAGAAAAPGG